MISLDEAMLYAPVEWHDCSEGYTDIRYHKSADGIAKICARQAITAAGLSRCALCPAW